LRSRLLRGQTAATLLDQGHGLSLARSNPN
jgi:hypothetical protein